MEIYTSTDMTKHTKMQHEHKLNRDINSIILVTWMLCWWLTVRMRCLKQILHAPIFVDDSRATTIPGCLMLMSNAWSACRGVAVRFLSREISAVKMPASSIIITHNLVVAHVFSNERYWTPVVATAWMYARIGARGKSERMNRKYFHSFYDGLL